MLDANAEALLRVARSQRSVALVAAVRDAVAEVLRRRVSEAPIVSNLSALLDYMHATMAYRRVECVRVVHLNARNRLIRDELVAEGTIDNAHIHVREIVRRALELGSAAMILVHNHPSGDPSPSQRDIQFTRDLMNALKPLAIQVHDHIVVAATGYVSLRAQGVI